jgi:hypothetical protein
MRIIVILNILHIQEMPVRQATSTVENIHSNLSITNDLLQISLQVQGLYKNNRLNGASVHATFGRLTE